MSNGSNDTKAATGQFFGVARATASREGATSAPTHQNGQGSSFDAGVMRTTISTNREGTQETHQETRGGIIRSGDNQRSAHNVAPVFTSTMGRALGAHEVGPKSLVTVGGVTTSVAAALHAGLIKQVAGGGYEGTGVEEVVETDDRSPKPRADVEEKDTIPEIETFDPATEALLTETIDGLGNQLGAHAVHEIITQDGRLSEDTVAALAGRLGIEGHESVERASTIKDAFIRQGNAAVGEAAAPAIWAWAHANRPADIKAAMSRHANTGDTSSYKAIAADYYSSLANTKAGRATILSSPDAKARGITQVGDKIYVDVPRIGRVLWSAAVRGGYITPGHTQGR